MSIKDYLLHYKQFKFLLDEAKFQKRQNYKEKLFL